MEVPEECTLLGCVSLVRAVVSMNPSAVVTDFTNPAADDASLSGMVVFPNTTLPQPIQLRSGENLYIAPYAADLPGWVQLFFSDDATDVIS